MPLAQLWWQFIKIGAAAFGGLGVTLSLIERDLVNNRRVLTAGDVTESLTYTKLLPGSTGVQVVAYLGYRLGGLGRRRIVDKRFSSSCFLPDAGVIDPL